MLPRAAFWLGSKNTLNRLINNICQRMLSVIGSGRHRRRCDL